MGERISGADFWVTDFEVDVDTGIVYFTKESIERVLNKKEK